MATNIFLGAAIGGIGMLAENRAKGRDPRDREVSDTLQSKAQHNVPIPVVFGRGRLSASYAQLGNYFMIDDFARTDGGTNFFCQNSIMALCEGEIRAADNYRISGMTMDELAESLQLKGDEDERNEKRYRYMFTGALSGRSDQNLLGALGQFYDYVDDSEGEDSAQPAFTVSDHFKIPYRSTALLRLRCVCSTQGPAMLDVSGDILGPALMLKREIPLSDVTTGNQISKIQYDGHSETFACCVSASSVTAPWGMFRYSRWAPSTQEHTPPPENESDSILRGWYLGRHDTLIYQSPSNPPVFHIGSWGISRDSSGWSTHQPSSDYGAPVVCDALDELHAMLHTLHEGEGGTHYIMRWGLISGAIERVDTTLGAGSYRHLLFSPELNAYVVVSSDRIHLLSPQTGREMDSRPKDNAGSIGAFSSGRMIGVIFNDRVRMWDPADNIDVTYPSEGSSITGIESSDGTPKPCLSTAICSSQNTWTGHVSLGCFESGEYAVVNFLPSIVEEREENSFIGTASATDSTPYDTLMGRKWVRDFSIRTPSIVRLRLLEGESSISAAAYSILFSEPTYDSERWGAGIDPSLASLSSFESLHARCVAPERYLRSNSDRWETDYALKRAYEFKIKRCGLSGKYTERFEPVNPEPHTWESAEGGRLWFNSPDSPSYQDLGRHSGDCDNKFILRTSKMMAAPGFLYMTAGKTNSMSPPTSTDAWDAGHNAFCVTGRGRERLKIDSIRAVTRAEDDIDSPEQSAEMIWCERYRVNHVLDAQTSIANVVDDIFLAACNGYRYMTDGKLHVGIPVPGRLPMLTLRDDMREGSGQLVLSAGQRPNVIVLQYANLFDEYRVDHQIAFDDFAIQAEGAALIEAPSNPGITRPGQA